MELYCTVNGTNELVFMYSFDSLLEARAKLIREELEDRQDEEYGSYSYVIKDQDGNVVELEPMYDFLNAECKKLAEKIKETEDIPAVMHLARICCDAWDNGDITTEQLNELSDLFE